ncbi:helix-turn-helix domain-containing protein [Actinomadura opuntiae]|uniref:helix-turn-helix domain-containing protein n=1 Tax=Actinomadura sp. OS1-43 TaxID=604315 RepID=UPI00255B1929|nr:helix-turn-helix transcriptional regulator [Actinomadura sp. OS1-43]MDL4817751.1 helix-turn-helix transcriptional regulator [Actinomadura sp. OS1-43]
MGSRRESYESPAILTFAAEVTFWRTEAQLNKLELAEKLGYTSQWIGQIEAGKNSPSENFAKDLDTFFKTNGLFRRLWKRIVETRHRIVRPPGFSHYLELEVEASTLRAFDVAMVNGLLQTESYMRTVLGRNQRVDIVDDLVKDRLKRQEIFVAEHAPQAWFTIDEYALRRMVGGPEVVREQLRHLLTIGELSNVWIDVVPQNAGYYPGLGGSFMMLGFVDLPDVAYIEAGGQGILFQEKSAVAEYAVLYNLLRGDALRVEESRSLISKIMEDVGR